MKSGKNYLFSVLDLTRKRILFYSWINNLLKLEQEGSFTASMYTDVFTHMINTARAENPLLNPIEILVGFGPAECRWFSERSDTLTFHYDVKGVHDECFTQVKAEIERQQGPVNYVSLQNKSESAWRKFLIKSFISTLSLPEPWGKKCQEVILEFKQIFLGGVEHMTQIGLEESKIIINLTDTTSAQLLVNVKSYPAQHGVITMQLGNGNESDFIYMLAQHERETILCCFRFQGENHGVSIATFDEHGTMTLHSPTGKNDVLNTVKLIGLLYPAQSGCNLFRIIKGQELMIAGTDPDDLLRISRPQILVRQAAKD